MSDEQSSQPAVQTSTLNRSWLVKMVIFTVVLFGFGLWGLYDATIAYPQRGAYYAEYAQWRFLDAAKLAGKINTATDIADPKARFDELSHKTRSDLEQAEMDWLESLQRIGQLDAEHTRIAGPNKLLDERAQRWKGQDQPKPLAAYDMPLQWSFVFIGFGLGVYVVFNIVRSASRRYTWEESACALTLPGGKRVTPEQLADVDKKKWHKFFCSLVFNDGSEPVELDLLKYSGVEEWVLTLERTRFPDRAQHEEEEASPLAQDDADHPPADPVA